MIPTIPNPALVRTNATTRLARVYRLLLEIAKRKGVVNGEVDCERGGIAVHGNSK